MLNYILNGRNKINLKFFFDKITWVFYYNLVCQQ